MGPKNMQYSHKKRISRKKKVALISVIIFFILSIFSYVLLKKRELPRGLEAIYFQNESFYGLPTALELSRMINLSSAKIDEVSPTRTNYSIEWKGYLLINEEGLYEFTTVSDDGSVVFIDNILVVDNGGFHPLRKVSGRIFLRPDFHSIWVRYCQGSGSDVLLFYGNKLGTKSMPIHGEQLFPYLPSYQSLILDHTIKEYYIVLRAIWGFIIIFILFFLITKILRAISKKADITYLSFIKTHYILIIIIAIGFTLRFIGIGYGLPQPYHPDEKQVMSKASRIIAGDLNPHFFIWPTLYMYLIAIFYKFSYWLIWLLQYFFGFIHPLKRLYLLIHSNIITSYHYYLISRGISIIFGTITIPVTYLIGKELSSKKAGLIAALFIALAYYPVLYSHLGIISTTMVCLTLLSFYFAIKMYQTGRFKYYFEASIIGGLAIAAKYNAAIIIIPIFLAHLFLFLKNSYKFNRKFYLRAIIIILFVLIGFFIGCPYSLINYEKFTKDISWVVESQKGLQNTSIYFKGIQSSSWAMDFKFLWEGMGPFLLILSLAGIILSLFKRKYPYLLLLSFPLCYFLMASQSKTPVPRYTLIIYPFLLLLASMFIIFLNKYFRSFPKAFLIGIIIVALSIPFYHVIKLDYYLCQKDTRQLALEWIRKNMPQGSKVAYEFFGPDPSILEGIVTYRQFSLGDNTFKYYQDRKIDYFISDSLTRNIYFKAGEKYFPTHIEFYLLLNKRCKLIKKYENNPIFIFNPTIWVYKALY